MSGNSKSFIITLLGATAALLALAVLFNANGWLISRPVLHVLVCVVPAFALLTYFLYSYILRANAKSPQRFVSAFTGAVAVKLFASIIFLGIYIYNGGEDRVVVAMSTFGTYVVYNVLMIRYLLAAVRKR